MFSLLSEGGYFMMKSISIFHTTTVSCLNGNNLYSAKEKSEKAKNGIMHKIMEKKSIPNSPQPH